MRRIYALRTWNRSQAASCTLYDDDDDLFPRASRLLVCVCVFDALADLDEMQRYRTAHKTEYTECERQYMLEQMYCLSSPHPKSKFPKVPLTNKHTSCTNAYTHTQSERNPRKFFEFTTIIIWIFVFVSVWSLFFFVNIYTHTYIWIDLTLLAFEWRLH